MEANLQRSIEGISSSLQSTVVLMMLMLLGSAIS